MDTIKAFEKKMREANYASLDLARAALLAHSLAADFMLAVLVDRGALAVTEDGAVVGGRGSVEKAPAASRTEERSALGAQDWRPEWPKRDLLMAYLDCPEGEASVKFRWVQKMLASRGQPATHWITLHAIWHLMKHGFAVKDRGGYRLTELGQNSYVGLAEDGANEPMADNEQVGEFRAALKEMNGACLAALEEALGEMPDGCSAKELTAAFAQYVDSGEWMGRPEMRGGFNLAFTRWVQAEFKNGSLNP